MPGIGQATTFKFEVDGLGPALVVARFEGTEALSELFHYELTLTSAEKDIAFADVIGKNALLTLDSDASEPRFVHGIVSRFEHGDDGKTHASYHATLVPSVWRLQHRHDSRIFQHLTVPDIIKKVLTGAGIAAAGFRMGVQGSYQPREYCVQYRESDWAFICRLMEEVGIYYFFEHQDGSHVLVMGDAASGHTPITAPDTIAFRAPLGAMAHGESVSRFTLSEEVRPGKISLSDFDFEKPSLSLLTSKEASTDGDLEIYDYPGEYLVPAEGTQLAGIRLEEAQARRQVGKGESGCIRMTAGYLFSVSDHARDSVNRKYLLIEVRHEGSQPHLGGGDGGDAHGYHNRFRVIPDDVPFRPLRRTPRPTVKGVQTAIVTGPAGEEIYPDKHGRVKVQFHWDRLGKKDENTSCWVRVSQLWAGAGWGAMYIPRIGQEVIVDFIEGDPDRPIVTGRVYHGTNVPPYPLPAEKTKSTIKSNTSKGGGGSNEFRFEDKAGSEEIYLHGQKDWNIKIENDKTQLIGHDEKLQVGNDRTKEVKHDQFAKIGHDKTETVGNDKAVEVGHDFRETIKNDEFVHVSGKADRHVVKDQSGTVEGNNSLSVAKNQSETVGASKKTSVAANMDVAVTGNLSVSSANSAEAVQQAKSLDVGGDLAVNVKKGATLSVSKDLVENVSGEQKTTITKKLTLTVGEGSVTVEKNGNITIKGKDITIKGDGKINVQASSKIVIKSDGPVDVEAGGKVKVKGSAIDMN